jgi:hypothetical protein
MPEPLGCSALKIEDVHRQSFTVHMTTNEQVSTAITAKQQATIDAIRAFFLNEDEWAKVEAALTAARAETYIENPEIPRKSKSWHLDTIVRDSYFDLRQIGLDDETAWFAMKDC